MTYLSRVYKFNPYHEPAGSSRGGRFAISPSRQGQLSEIFKRISEPDRGFTYHVVSGREPKEGYAVSPYPDRSFATDVKALTPTELYSYIKKNRDILRRSNHYLGGWHDPASGKVFLDVSIVSKTPKEAEALAQKHDQIAYFDLGKMTSVTVNAKATSGGVVKGESYG